MTDHDRRYPWALRIVITLLWITAAVPAVLPADASNGDHARVAAAAAIAWAAATQLALGVRGLVTRVTNRRPPWLELGLNGLVGAVSGALVVIVATWFDVTRVSPPTLWIAVCALGTAWGLTTADVLVSARETFERERAELASTASELARVSASQESLIAELRASILAAVDAELIPARQSVARQLSLLETASTDAAWADAPQLGDVAHDSLRPLIGLLDSDPQIAPIRVNTWSFFWSVVRTQSFQPLELSVIYVLTTLPGYWAARGAADSWRLVTFGLVALLAITLGANLLMKLVPRVHALVFLAAVALLQVPTVMFILEDSTRSPAERAAQVIVAVVFSVVIVMLVSSVGSWRSGNEHALAAFGRYLDDRRAATSARAELSALVARDAARVLHGPMQARLAACAIAIEAAVQARDVAAYAQALRQAHDVLRDPLLASPVGPGDLSIATAVDELVALWRGLIDIHVDIDPTVATATENSADVGRVIEEAVTNAVRHGDASAVWITVARAADGLELRVRDDGRGPTGQAPGLGTAMIDEVTRGSWSLARVEPGGALLTASIPVVRGAQAHPVR